MKVRNLITLVFSVVLTVGLFGVAIAEDNADRPAPENFAGAWYYPWVGPNYHEFGDPDHGVAWQKDFEGEVAYIDSLRLQLAAQGSGDIMNFFLYPGQTYYTPSWEGVRVGSKVKVRSDDRHRVRWVEVVPFHVWLAQQTK
ncbi:MAG: hypothetical protein HY319_23665 [Armatimonadetes bacterium]|nr:hypothetical protein [Armatimonadota bacterium]